MYKLINILPKQKVVLNSVGIEIIYFQYNYLTPFVQKGVSKTLSSNIHVLFTIATSVRILLLFFFFQRKGEELELELKPEKNRKVRKIKW